MDIRIKGCTKNGGVKEDIMGNRLVWQDRYNIGVDFIDKEHKKLFSIMNRLLSFIDQEDKSQWVCQEGVKYFKGHALKHFSEEEAYMASIDYIGYETHRRLHDNFRRKTLPALEEELRLTEYSKESVSHFLGVCAGWLIGHTLTEDRAMTGQGQSKWSGLLPDEEQMAMKHTILSLLSDMFQLNARVISECYGGERFGNGIYYRLVYGAGKEEKWEVLLSFEERVIINTIGKIMGGKSSKVNVMIVNATRYAARQFVDRIRNLFPSTEEYEIQEENLLSYEQLQKVFARQQPQFSLLFDTGEGYFAYSAFAPHLIKDKTAVKIDTANAMTEIKKYIGNNEPTNRKKVLVVDDSSVMRQAMKDLLQNEYQVSDAESGLAAIRCITLDKPDLILLDYEMPVCDGKQVLQMIRAEKEFADLPVIFLTGRGDLETVRAVMSLKPAGYLLKNLRPDDIKKTIYDFFAGRK